MRHLSLFTGAGGCDLAAQHLLGWETVGYVEFNDYCQRVIKQRIEDGFFHDAPIFSDIRAFLSEGYAEAYQGLVDVISGGFPCQDISCAGSGKGIGGERSGLWGSMADVIRIIRPRFVFVENSPMLTIHGLGRVLGDLAEMGFDARWGVLGALHIGLPHNRRRIWIVANSNEQRGESISWWASKVSRNLGKHQQAISQAHRVVEGVFSEGNEWEDKRKSSLPPYLCRVDDEVARNVDRLKAIGNGQVPAVAATAFRLLAGEITQS